MIASSEHTIAEATQDTLLFDAYGVRVVADQESLVTQYETDLTYRSSADNTEKLALTIAQETRVAAHALQERPTYWSLFGYSVETVGTQTTLHTPSTSRLNALRAELAPLTGIHMGTFVDFPGGLITPWRIAEFVADRCIPMASAEHDLYYAVHDNVEHRPGYATLCEKIFSRFVYVAQTARLTHDHELAGKMVKAMDLLSAVHNDWLLGADNGATLAAQYSRFMPGVLSRVAAYTDIRVQNKTIQSITAQTRT